MNDETLKKQLSVEKIKLIEKYFLNCYDDIEFLKHKPSGKMIHIRNLKSIKNIEEFRKFCSILESLE